MIKEEYAELIYKNILNIVYDIFKHNKTTYMSELLNIGNKLIKNFKGVYPSDLIPKLKNNQSCILNLDSSRENGSHWISVYKYKNKLYVYDSFGRKAKEIIPTLKNKIIIDTDNDKEQKYSELNCGQRCIAWLILFNRWGYKYALLI